VAGHIRSIAQQAGAAALASAVAQGGQDKALDFGLQRILDGIGLLVARRGAEPRGATS
jgi:hypothetical protein